MPPDLEPLELQVFAREPLRELSRVPQGATLLLEGTWSEEAEFNGQPTLDEALDGRWSWIDVMAEDLAEKSARSTTASLAYLNALKLRYYLVKLLRVAAYFQTWWPENRAVAIRLHVAPHQDQDYADLFAEICRGRNATLDVRWHNSPPPTPPQPPLNPLWRRLAGWLSRGFDSRRPSTNDRPRFLLCGNPAILEPVCTELLDRNGQVAWLFDRFAVHSWRRWRAAGVRQFHCDSSLGRENRLHAACQRPLEGCGVDLAGPVTRWLAARAESVGPQQTRMLERIEQHVGHFRPDVLLLDEDATPLARAVIAVGRRHGIRSVVVQHGVPCVRFGFAPAAADHVCAWGEVSRQQLIGWGLAPETISNTGSPKHDGLIRRARKPAVRRPSSAPRILLLGTVPPQDDRPDAVAFQLTTRSHREILRVACNALSKLKALELIVKPHPRTPDPAVFRQVLAEFPQLHARIVSSGDLPALLADCDCVLSCASSAGIEAALFGLPVIQLMPHGSLDILPAKEWGLAGTARTENELDRLLSAVLSNDAGPLSPRSPDPRVFANLHRPATDQIVDLLWTLLPAGFSDAHGHSPHLCRPDL